MRRTIFSLTLLLMAAFSSFAEQPSPAQTVSQTADARPEEAPDSSAPEGTAETSAPEFDIDVHVIFNDSDVAKIDPTLRINKLHLAGTRVTNASLDEVRLSAMVNLLSIEGTQITNAGLERLKGMTKLRSLRLWNRRFTDSALIRIKGLPRLESLDLEGTSVQGTTLAHLSELKALRTLILGPYVEDDALKALRSLPALEELDLRSCHHISDAGLSHLKGLKNLRIVWLPVQTAELSELRLRQALPTCDLRR
jgi:hypothetical protein